MTDPVFHVQIDRLKQTFGKQHFPDTRVKEIVVVCHDLSDEQFTRIVTRMVGEIHVDYPPNVKNFREFAQSERQKVVNIDQQKGWTAPKSQRHFNTSQEAFDDIHQFFLETIQANGFHEALKDKVTFFDHSKLVNLELHNYVSTLRSQVAAGSIEARTPYVEAAKKLIIDTTIATLFKGVRPVPSANGKAGA